MKDKGPGGADARPEEGGGRKRKNDSHERIGQMLGEVYKPIEKEPLPDTLLEILSRIPDQVPGEDEERS